MMPAPLSTEATRLLGLLRAERINSPAAAWTDKRIAAAIHIPQRGVIDAAGELLEAGYLVIASCGGTPGRFLICLGDDLGPARRYCHQLTHRCIEIFRRRRALKRSIQRYEVAARGHQLALFGVAS